MSELPYTLYIKEINGEGNRRERERATVSAMIAEAAGPDARAAHTRAGAPYIEGMAVYVSVSHSQHLAVLALSRSARIGVDIEEYRGAQLCRIAGRVLSPAELEYYKGEEMLLQAWTLKEAAFKAIAEGPADLRQIQLPCTAGDKTISYNNCRLHIAQSGRIKAGATEAWLSVVYSLVP